MLCWTLLSINKEGLVRTVKLKGSLDCSDHEMVEFEILTAASRAHSKLTALNFRKADSGLIRDLVEYHSIKPEGRRTLESWLIFKN